MKHFLPLLAIASASLALAQPAVTPADAELFPPDAKPGHCYARVFIPPQYGTQTETVLKQAAYERIDIVQPRFEPATENVVVREASERLEVVPAVFGPVSERVLVKPASKRLVTEPAQFETLTEQVLVKPAHTVWKKGRGPVEQLDNSTGEIMCLIEVPAQYETVTKRVVKTPAQTREVETPAEYKTITRSVMKTPPTTRKITIPAEYAAITVMKPVSEAGVARQTVPAVNQTVSKTVQTSDGRMAWREILCETNMNPAVVQDIQRNLAAGNYYNGPIDGLIGSGTVAAVRSFQRAKGLPVGHLTIDSLKSLGVSVGGGE